MLPDQLLLLRTRIRGESIMSSTVIMITIALAYVVIMTTLGVYMKKYSKTTDQFMTGGKNFGPFVIGALMMSEFIAISATTGTAQTAYTVGISASWSLLTLLLAFVLFALFLARKFRERGEYTISGAISKTYGNNARLLTSVIMMYALFVINISTYASGAAMVGVLLNVPKITAVIIVGLVSVIYVTTGGMSAVAYTNVVHVIVKYLGVIIAATVGLAAVGGFSQLPVHLKPEMFSWTNIGWPTIIAWTIANLGTIFSTQYVIQAISSTSNTNKAIKASICAGLLVVPIALLIALVGLCSKVLFPAIPSAQAFPILIRLMNPLAGGLVVAGLVAAVFSTASAVALAGAALLMNDFYIPFINKNATDTEALRFSRISTIMMGLLPIPFAIFVPQILNTLFFARGLRTSISAVVVLMFYAPHFSSGRGATIGMLIAAIVTTVWYLANNPFKIDSIYIAAATPLIIMGLDHLYRQYFRERPLNS